MSEDKETAGAHPTEGVQKPKRKCSKMADVWSKRYRHYTLTPVALFIGTWFIMFGLYGVGILVFGPALYRLSTSAFLLYLVSTMAFVGGSGVAWGIHVRGIPRQPGYHAADGALPLVRAWTILYAVALAVAVGYRVDIVVHRYGNFLHVLRQVRIDFSTGTLAFPMFSSVATILENVAILNCGVWLAYRARGTAIGVTTLVLFLVLINDMVTADGEGLRLVVLLGFTAYFATTMIYRRSLRQGHYVKGIVGAGVFAGCYALITYLRTNGNASILDVTLRHFTFTIAGNLVSSSWFIAHPMPFGTTFHGIATAINALATEVTGHKVLPEFGRTDLQAAYQAFLAGRFDAGASFYAPVLQGMLQGAVRPLPFNTTTYLGYVYSDFGVRGVVLLSGLWGAASTAVFLWARSSGSIVAIQVLALVSLGILMSVRGLYYGGAGFWVTVACVLVQGYALDALSSVRHGDLGDARKLKSAN